MRYILWINNKQYILIILKISSCIKKLCCKNYCPFFFSVTIPSALTNVYMLNFLVKLYQNILLWYPYFVLIFWTFIVNQSQTLSVSDVISVWSALCVMFYGVKLASSSLHKPLSHKTRINQLTISCWVAKVCLCSVRWHCEIINSVYTFFSCKQTIAACLDSRQLMGVNISCLQMCL